MADPSYMKMFMDEVAAFKGREVGKLQEVANNMDREVFAYDLQRCIDAGLWIPNAIEAQGEEMDAGEEQSVIAATVPEKIECEVPVFGIDLHRSVLACGAVRPFLGYRDSVLRGAGLFPTCPSIIRESRPCD
uniref:CDC37_C domain-containing protein n=1 Tax=Steinernema glaseri TaxID=37863 RepID=A0A1I8A624_9BILA